LSEGKYQGNYRTLLGIWQVFGLQTRSLPGLGQKMCKLCKKIIALSDFDDYYAWFGYED